MECKLDLKIDGDDVILAEVLDKEDTGRLVIPSFVTKIDGVRSKYQYPFMRCKYSDVYIENRVDRGISCKYLFAYMGCDKLRVVFKHPECIVNAYGMFMGCTILKDLDISELRLSNVRNVGKMFNMCKVIEDVDLSNLDLRNVVRVDKMFKDCYKLHNVNFKGISLSKLENMDGMFSVCPNLSSIDMSDINSKVVKNTNDMFKLCVRLESVNLGSIDIGVVVDRSSMFGGCRNLKSVRHKNGVVLI